MTPDHSWFQKRLLPLALGLLTPEEETEVTAHVSGCESCARSLQDLNAQLPAATDEDEAIHVDPEVLALWPASLDQMSALERTMVRQHLDTCGQCREDLQSIGQEADLAGPPHPRALPEGPKESGDAKVVRMPERSRSPWLLTWAVGSTVAAAASILLLLAGPVGKWGDPDLGPAGASGFMQIPKVTLGQGSRSVDNSRGDSQQTPARQDSARGDLGEGGRAAYPYPATVLEVSPEQPGVLLYIPNEMAWDYSVFLQELESTKTVLSKKVTTPDLDGRYARLFLSLQDIPAGEYVLEWSYDIRTSNPEDAGLFPNGHQVLIIQK